MPHADGFAVLDAARRAHASCYVVIITGYASIDVAVQAVRAGAYDLLAKPFALAQLELVLARIKDRMALESENRQLLGNRKAPDAVLIDPAFERRLREHQVPFEEMVLPNEIHGFLRHASWLRADAATVDFLQRKLGLTQP